MSDLEIIKNTNQKHIGHTLYKYKITDSTNNRAQEFANDPNNHGTIFIAREQSNGRGQYGRDWSSLPDEGIWLSILLFLPERLQHPVLITAFSAVVISDWVDKITNSRSNIKWPNDIYLKEKKIAGILTECGMKNGSDAVKTWTIAGIGINIQQSAEKFHSLGLNQAGSLQMFTNQQLDTESLSLNLIEQFDQSYESFIHDPIASIESRWCSKLRLQNQPVEIITMSHNTFHGTVVELSFSKIILQEIDSLLLLPFKPEEIRNIHLLFPER